MNHALKSVILYTTTDCNHKCNHCFLGHNGSWEAKELLRISSLLKKQCSVTINGAETLLHPEYLEAYKIAEQNYVYSNGLVFLTDHAPSVFEQMKKNGITNVRLSHHFQAIEQLNAIPAEKVVQVVKILQRNGFCVEFNSTVTNANYQHLDMNCRYAVQLGVKRIKFFPLFCIGNAKNIEKNADLSHEQLKVFYNELSNLRRKYDINTLELRIGGNLEGIAPKFNCVFGKGMYTITPDNKVYGCPYAISVIPPIGFLKENGEIVIDRPVEHDGKKCLVANASVNCDA